jgi:hypothetical protein
MEQQCQIAGTDVAVLVLMYLPELQALLSNQERWGWTQVRGVSAWDHGREAMLSNQ